MTVPFTVFIYIICPFQIFNLNKCPLRVAMLDVNLRLNQYRLRMKVINEILKRMNASVEYMTPESGEQGAICGPAEHTGIRGMVVSDLKQ